LHADTVLDIGHESLIRRWEKMNEWVEQEANSAATYRHLEETARLWKSGKSALWGTPGLDVALEWKKQEKPSPAWAARYGGDFDRAMEFLQRSEDKRREDEAASEAARRRELDQARAFAEAQEQRAEAERRRAEEQKLYAESERRRAESEGMRAESERVRAAEQMRMARRFRMLSAVLTVMVVLAVIAVSIAWNERQKAAAEQGRSFSRGLAMVAIENLNVDQDKSLLLALHALSITYPFEKYVAHEVEDALHQAVQASRLRATFRGHSGKITGITFSPDGRSLVTASADGTARVWRVASPEAEP
jgi:hypothetical protein